MHDAHSALLSRLLGPTKDVGISDVRAVAIQSLNGAATVGGTSGGLGNELDQQVLLTLRSWADLILVTATTADAESYGPVQLSPEAQQERTNRGQAPLPTLVLWDRSLNAIRQSVHLQELAQHPNTVVLTRGSVHTTSTELALPHAITYKGEGAEAVAALREHLPHSARVSVEGGPHVYSELLGAGLVDTLHLSISPVISEHIEHPLFAPEHAVHLEPEFVHVEGLIFTRLRVRRGDE
ncbi:dihydrofolate reductase family protein [Corynebacterium kozikiae]|uniref:dihydrofolate reductase family protein n=1 Tax=Corynebacterium kozikiae TaxID=2968469 RepID=UPI00211CCD70|nr:dihydrofolate reductase family protein [Corynebacterium sp. 76QC2CO]MCQ9342496.1 dihydrofolate reductase family protein [Corynebacterium sp. 76QC2CO]